MLNFRRVAVGVLLRSIIPEAFCATVFKPSFSKDTQAGRIMTSPSRKRADRSRKRLTEIERLEIVERAQRYLKHESPGDTREPCAPLTRSDCLLIGRAIRGGWDVPEAKRREIVQQTLAALNSDDERLSISAAQLVIAMEGANHEKR